MSEVKWIKIVTDIFDDEKMLFIDAMPDADAIIVIWFKLLCLAGKQNNSGVMLLNDRIPYTDDMFANIFRRKVATVRLALKTFESLGMVEIINDTVTIPNWGKHQNLEGLERQRQSGKERVARYRQKQRQSALPHGDSGTNSAASDSGCNVTVTLPSRYSNVTVTGIEEEVDIERDIDIDNKESSSSGGSADALHPHDEKPCEENNESTSFSVQEQPVIQIELIDGTLYDVTKSELDYYSKLYPAVNVMQEFRNIAGWNHSNPKKRKTRSGIKRHINTWLSDKQNKSRTVFNNSWEASREARITVSDTVYDDENPFRRNA